MVDVMDIRDEPTELADEDAVSMVEDAEPEGCEEDEVSDAPLDSGEEKDPVTLEEGVKVNDVGDPLRLSCDSELPFPLRDKDTVGVRLPQVEVEPVELLRPTSGDFNELDIFVEFDARLALISKVGKLVVGVVSVGSLVVTVAKSRLLDTFESGSSTEVSFETLSIVLMEIGIAPISRISTCGP